MKCVRFEDLRTGNKRIGFIDGDVIRCVYGSLETYWQITDETFAMRDVRLLAPCVPKQIICISFNYQKHAAEFGVEIPVHPAGAAHAPLPYTANNGRYSQYAQTHQNLAPVPGR